MSKAPLARVLVVDDERPHMKALCSTLETEGYSTGGVSSANEALALLHEERFDLVLTDLMMPEMDGIALLEAARKSDPHLAGIVMTGHGTIDTAVKALQIGALDYIQKPFNLKVLLPVIGRALAVRRLAIENEELAHCVQARTLELEVANAELDAANKELEAFSYSVSHDLRAPLRAVQGYCGILSEDFGAGLSDAAQDILGKAIAGAERMDELIEDLLALSKCSRQPLVRRRVDVHALVRRVVDGLASIEKERRVVVVISVLPECWADASLLEQVFANLLANAFKFTKRVEKAHIEVGVIESAPEEVAYFVRDNGAGFDMKRADRLFGAFQRLHSASEFEGTGIGLSIVKRIVQRHGGRIWADARRGEGATFYFSVERAQVS